MIYKKSKERENIVKDIRYRIRFRDDLDIGNIRKGI